MGTKAVEKAAVTPEIVQPGDPVGLSLVPEGAIANVWMQDLRTDPTNARQHGERNIEEIKRSLQRFGQQKPIVVDTGGVIRAGNGTYAAAQALGWDSIVVRRSELTEAEIVAYAIVDNRTSELADWDTEQLMAIVDEFQMDPELLGFNADEIRELSAAVDMKDFEKPTLAGAPEVAGKHEFDGNWFYIEYYGNDAEYARVRELLGDALKGKEIDQNIFSKMSELLSESRKGT